MLDWLNDWLIRKGLEENGLYYYILVYCLIDKMIDWSEKGLKKMDCMIIFWCIAWLIKWLIDQKRAWRKWIVLLYFGELLNWLNDWLIRKGLEENEILETQIDENTRELNALKLDLNEGKILFTFCQRLHN